MSIKDIPPMCIPCLEKFQAQCPHLRVHWIGDWHFYAGEVWDDIACVCSDCGLLLENLTSEPQAWDDDPIPL